MTEDTQQNKDIAQERIRVRVPGILGPIIYKRFFKDDYLEVIRKYFLFVLGFFFFTQFIVWQFFTLDHTAYPRTLVNFGLVTMGFYIIFVFIKLFTKGEKNVLARNGPGSYTRGHIDLGPRAQKLAKGFKFILILMIICSLFLLAYITVTEYNSIAR